MQTDRPRVIFDCNTVLQGFLSPNGPGGACLRLVQDHRVTLLMSPDILAEMRDVLARPFVRAKRPDLTLELADQLLAALAYLAVIMRDVPKGPQYSRDPYDQPYLDLAVAGEADYLITRDNDLLRPAYLNDGPLCRAKQFRQRHQNRLRILPPQVFLNEMGVLK